MLWKLNCIIKSFDAGIESDSSSGEDGLTQLDWTDELALQIYHRIKRGKRGPQKQSIKAHFKNIMGLQVLRSKNNYCSRVGPLVVESSVDSAPFGPHMKCQDDQGITPVWNPQGPDLTVHCREFHMAPSESNSLPEGLLCYPAKHPCLLFKLKQETATTHQRRKKLEPGIQPVDGPVGDRIEQINYVAAANRMKIRRVRKKRVCRD